jgi:hypothetical protein
MQRSTWTLYPPPPTHPGQRSTRIRRWILTRTREVHAEIPVVHTRQPHIFPPWTAEDTSQFREPTINANCCLITRQPIRAVVLNRQGEHSVGAVLTRQLSTSLSNITDCHTLQCVGDCHAIMPALTQRRGQNGYSKWQTYTWLVYLQVTTANISNVL